METSPTDSHWTARVGYGLAGLLLLYVLGFGPAGYIHERSKDSPNLRTALKIIYTPVFLLEKTPFRGPIGAYANWWLELARNRNRTTP